MATATELDSSDISRLVNSVFEYRYQELSRCGDAAIRQYIERTREPSAPIATGFDDERNAEWFSSSR